jgi:hypothetical protein
MEALLLGGAIVFQLGVFAAIWRWRMARRLQSPPYQTLERPPHTVLLHEKGDPVLSTELLWTHRPSVEVVFGGPQPQFADSILCARMHSAFPEEFMRDFCQIARTVDAAAIALMNQGFVREGDRLVGELNGRPVTATASGPLLTLAVDLDVHMRASAGSGSCGNPVLDALIDSSGVPEGDEGRILGFVHGEGGRIEGGQTQGCTATLSGPTLAPLLAAMTALLAN